MAKGFLIATTTICGSFDEVDAAQWDGLLAGSAAPSPFLSWDFLSLLEQTGCASAASGWQPLPILVRNGQGDLVAAAPLYAKGHSYGEYVFDWAWAEAYGRAGLEYFPKLVVASPFSPIPGTRLLGGHGDLKHELIRAIQAQADNSGLSSAHVLFPDEADVHALKQAGWLIRENVQFHLCNSGFSSFDDYLASLSQPKRKKVKAERRKVREAGVQTRMLAGEEIQEPDLEFFYRCYERTYQEHHSTPYMTLDFFRRLRSLMPETLVLCIAERAGQPIASSLLMTANRVLYGRYWGALERVDCLHFEVSYYAPIEWAITHGMVRFEGGAQGEHKLARGFQPVKTYSGHWLREPAFYDAVARYLERESRGIESYVNELESRSPFRPKPKAGLL